MTYDPKKAFQSPKIDADEMWLQRYEVDRRSVFIGNLPLDEEGLEEKIKEIMDEIGDVVTVQVIRKDGKNGETHPTMIEPECSQ
jgi:polyadenylate-binding protein